MKNFVKMTPLENKCNRYFEKLIKLSQTHSNYKAVITG